MSVKVVSADIMPKSIVYGRDVASMIESVMHNYKNWLNGDSVYGGISERFVMGYNTLNFGGVKHTEAERAKV